MKVTASYLRKLIQEALDTQSILGLPTPDHIINTVSGYLDAQSLVKLRSMFETDDIENVNSGLAILNSVYSMFEDKIPDDYINMYFTQWNEREVSNVAYAAPSIFLQKPTDMSGLWQ